MLSSPTSHKTTAAGKQRMEAEREEKEQLSAAADEPLHSPQPGPPGDERWPQSLVQKRRVLVKRLPSPALSQPFAAHPPQPSSQPSALSSPISPPGRRRVLVVRRPASESSQSILPPLNGHFAATSASAFNPVPLPSPHVPAAAVSSSGVLSIREREVLSRVAASSAAFSAFQSQLAGRVHRAPASLCMTNAADEYRVRMERAAVNEQERRIARQAAAAHIPQQLTAASEEGGLALPWEQSLRGATNHSVGVGGLFSGLYCKITQADMKEMQVVRSLKLIQEQPHLATQPQQQRGRGGVGAGAAGGGSTRSRKAAGTQRLDATAQLMDEAARLQQLSRLGTLGSKGTGSRPQQAALDDSQQAAAQQSAEEATLRLGDLIVRGTPLFDNLSPPMPHLAAAAADKDLSSADDPTIAAARVDSTSGGSELQQQPSAELPLSFVLSTCSLAFQQRHFPGDTRSSHITLHNPTASTLHFSLSRLSCQSAFNECGPLLAARSSFALSHPTGHVLPRASIQLCVTFCPPAAGLWCERWQLSQHDHDGESQPVTAATVTLSGSSHPTLATHNDTAGSGQLTLAVAPQQQQQPARDKESALLVCSSPSSSKAIADCPSDVALRSSFCRANSKLRLHFHRWLLPDWWRLWHDVRALHRPLDRQRMEWQLGAQQIEGAIQQLPRRHRQRLAALHDRLNQLQALAAVVPAPHPARASLLASLLTQLAASLPPFACQLALQHKHSTSPPWEVRARERERQQMEWEDSLGRMTDEQRQQATAEQQTRREQQRQDEEEEQEQEDSAIDYQQQQQQQVEVSEAHQAQSALTQESVKRREEAARVREGEARVDEEWRQRHGEYRQRLEEESTRVLAGAVGAFQARAGAMGSDQPPANTDCLSSEADLPVQLPILFPALIIELELETGQEKGKSKATKLKK